MKKIHSFDIFMPLSLLVLTLIAVGLGCLMEQRAVTVVYCSQESAGVNGPLRLNFTRPVQADTIEQNLRFTPSIKGELVWQNNSLLFWPAQPLETGHSYGLTLQAGARTLDGKAVAPLMDCEINIRPMRILYEAASVIKSQLLSMDLNGKNSSILADFEGEILSFDVAKSGNTIVLAVQNKAGGSDIWLVGRDGSEKKMLINCGVDHCTDPLWHPDSERIIYTREAAGRENAAKAQTWLLDTVTRVTSPLFENSDMQGVSYRFSPDGKKLAFYDDLNGGIRIVDLQTEATLLLKSNSTAMSWSPDSDSLIYFNQVQEDQQTYVNALLYSLSKHQSIIMLDEYHDQFEFGEPVWTPDGEWVTMAMRLARTQGSPTKQLALLKIDGSDVKMITEDQLYTQSVYHWSPDGLYLLFQRYKLGSSSSQPDIMLWDAGLKRMSVLLKGGSRPAWLP